MNRLRRFARFHGYDMNKRRLALLAVYLATPFAHAAPQGFEWFPRTPGLDDPIYLIFRPTCDVQGVFGTPHIRLLDAENGTWELNYTTTTEVCLGHRVSAVRVPETIDGVPVNWLEFAESRLAGDGTITRAAFSWGETLPARGPIPPAISGTWLSPGHREQGLLVNMSETGEIIVGWTTYGADGRQRWFSGIAAPASLAPSVTVTLWDTGDGAFAETKPNDAPATEWGTLTLDYEGCGKLRASWQPNADTGLQPGEASMQQLTPPRGAMCDITAYAAAHALQLDLRELIVDPPAQ